MYLPGELLNQDPLIDAVNINPEHPKSPVLLVSTGTGLVAREVREMDGSSPEGHPIDEAFVAALEHLETYGISYPGIGSLAVRNHNASDRVRVFTTEHFVDGYNLHTEIESIPEPVLIEAFGNILRYYEDMSQDFSDRPYLTDLSFINCRFGQPRGVGAISGAKPEVYFVDYDRLLSNIETLVWNSNRQLATLGFDGIKKLDEDLARLKERCPDYPFDEEAARLLQFARLGLVRMLPNAWEHVNGALVS
jgi:hypothetical protein